MSFFYKRLLPKTHVIYHETEYFVDTKTEDYVVLKHAHTASPQVLLKRDLEKAREEKKFRMADSISPYLRSTLTVSQREKIALDEKIAQAIAESTSPFSKVNDSKMYYAQLVTRQVLDEEGHTDRPTPSKSALQRLVSNYRSTGGDLSKLYIGKPNKRGKRLPVEIERLMRNVINNHFLTLNMPSVSSTYRKLKEACPTDLRDLLPNESTLRRRIGDLKQEDFIKGRHGEVAHRNYVRSSKKKIVVDELLERVELDAMHISLGLVDEKGIFIGYFTLYLAIDTASRMIVGYHIEPKTKLRGETPSGVLASINSILSDDTVYPLKDYPYPVSGIPELFVMDHGVAYQCKEVFERLKKLGIAFENTGTKRGSGKGIIERFIKSLRQRFFREVKGYRDSRLTQKYISGLEPKHDNCVKLSELRLALEHFIFKEYAEAPHSGIEHATPKQTWNNIYKNNPTQPADDFDIEITRAEQKSLTPNLQTGIRFKYQSFKSKALKALCIELANVKNGGKIGKVDVFYNHYDASTIIVIDPLSGEEIKAFNDNPKVKTHVSFVEVNARREHNKRVNEMAALEGGDIAPRPDVSDNKLPKNSRRRSHVNIPEDNKDEPININEVFSDDSGFQTPDTFEKQNVFNKDAQGFEWS